MAKSNTTTKDAVAEYVVNEFKGYSQYHKDRFIKADRIYQNWLGIPEHKGEEWQNRVFVPMTLDAEQTITPRLFSALFPNDTPIEVIVNGTQRHEGSMRIKGLLRKKFIQAGVHGEAYPAVSQCTLLGTGYISMGMWKTKFGWGPMMDPVTGNAKLKNDGTPEEERKLVYSRPDAEHIDYFEVFPHPSKMHVDDDLPLIRRHFVDTETLRELGKRSQAKDVSKALNSTCPEQDKELPLPLGLSNLTGKVYEVLEYWGRWSNEYISKSSDIGTEPAKPYWIVVINRQHVLWCIRNPYMHQRCPLCKIKLFPDVKPNWFGVGVGEVGKPCQERINKIVNQRLDNVDLVLKRQGIYNANDPLINKKKLKRNAPAQWHAVSDINAAMKYLDVPDVTASSYEEEKLAKEDFRQATGASAALAPAGKSEQHRTAMGINMLQGAAGQRFRPILKQMEIDLIRDGSLLFLSNLKQFMPKPEWVSVTTADGREAPMQISATDIMNMEVDIIPTGVSEMQEKEVLVGQLLRFKELTVNDPTVNRVEINRRLAELFGFKDVHKMLVNVEEPKNGGPLSAQEQLAIQQMVAEGTDPQLIKSRLMAMQGAA